MFMLTGKANILPTVSDDLINIAGSKEYLTSRQVVIICD